MIYHVAFLADAPLDAILAGTKRVEFRAGVKCGPFFGVAVHDHVFLKRVAGDIEALAVVRNIYRAVGPSLKEAVKSWFKLDPAAEAYLASKPEALYAVAIFLGDVRRVTFPPDRTPRRNRLGWVSGFDIGDWREIVGD